MERLQTTELEGILEKVNEVIDTLNDEMQSRSDPEQLQLLGADASPQVIIGVINDIILYLKGEL